MATAKGAWIATSNINAGFIDLARRRSKEITEDDLIAFNQRNHHYTLTLTTKVWISMDSYFIPISTKVSVRNSVFT